MIDQPVESPVQRCGLVAVVGAPNAGKSTLVNRLVGAKVSIVSPRVQTTRTRVTGIAVAGAAQLVFIDTPGIFRSPKRRLERAMVDAAWRGATDADVVLLVVDAAKGMDDDATRILEGLKGIHRRAVLTLNKIDLVKPPVLLQLTEQIVGSGIITDTFMISAITGDGVADLKRFLVEHMPRGPWLYPDDQLSDMPERLLAAEITREQVFNQLRQELPYAISVETESWKEFDDGSARVDQVIYVQREGQKAIVLGKGGSQVKKIGAAARKELESILGRRVHLFLHVKHRDTWSEERSYYRDWGLEFEA